MQRSISAGVVVGTKRAGVDVQRKWRASWSSAKDGFQLLEITLRRQQQSGRQRCAIGRWWIRVRHEVRRRAILRVCDALSGSAYGVEIDILLVHAYMLITPELIWSSVSSTCPRSLRR